jgi:UDP-N-acetyl-D-mannosaminuronic acid dehydrogenase
MTFETISVAGLGYIGLPTASILAVYGKNLIGVDVNQYAVDIINRGRIHIIEPNFIIDIKRVWC